MSLNINTKLKSSNVYSEYSRKDIPEDIKIVIRLAWPAIMEMLMATLVQYVDTAMVSRLGADATAAVGLSTSPMWLINGTIVALGMGTIARVSQYVGAEDYISAKKIIKQSVILSFISGLFISTLMFFLSDYIPVLMGGDLKIQSLSSTYLRILSYSFMLHFLSFILSAALRGAGNTKTPMKINIFANIVNVFGNFFMIFHSRIITIGGIWGIVPEVSINVWGADMGVAGAALATAVARGLSGVLMLCALLKGYNNIKLKLRESYKPDLIYIKKVLSIGLPSAMERFAVNLGQIVFISMIAGLGTLQLAAHHLSVIVESISFMQGNGYAVAATALVGQGVGAKEIHRAKVRGWVTNWICVCVMSFMGILFFSFPETFLRLFTDVEGVIAYGKISIRLMALSQPFFAMERVMGGALRGTGDGRTQFYAALMGVWLVRITGTWILINKFNIGFAAAWICIFMDYILRGLYLLFKFKKRVV